LQALHRRLLPPRPTLAARRPADASLPLLSRFRLVIVRHQPHPIPVTLLCPCALLVPHALQPTPAAVRLSSPRGVFPLGDFLPGTRMRMDSDPWAARETVLCAGLSARVRFRCAGYIPDAKPALLTRDTRRFLDVYRVCRCSVFWPYVRQFTRVGNRGGLRPGKGSIRGKYMACSSRHLSS
jgi:hypothetical protein